MFGALVRNRMISRLQHERLMAAVALWRAGKVEKIVVSNTSAATRLMAMHLRRYGIPAAAIERDERAALSVDTCRAKRDRRRHQQALNPRKTGLLTVGTRWRRR